MTDNDKVPELTNNEFNNFVKEGIVLVDFFAEWCMPCLMMSPVIDELSEKFDNVKFGKVNVEDGSETARKFSISSIPTFIIFRDGEVADRITGAVSGEELEERLRKFL
jgi:thioredoxin 1